MTNRETELLDAYYKDAFINDQRWKKKERSFVRYAVFNHNNVNWDKKTDAQKLMFFGWNEKVYKEIEKEVFNKYEDVATTAKEIALEKYEEIKNSPSFAEEGQ